MGKYIPAKPQRKKSVSDALQEAQEDHYIDCPDAEFLLRAAATILDFILILILINTTNRILFALGTMANVFLDSTTLPLWFSSLLTATDATLLYLYQIWTLQRFGASPAKLLFNLQVIDANSGTHLSLLQAIWREWVGKALSTAILGLGYLTPLMRDDSKTLHDLLAKTCVKRVDGGKG